MPANCGMRRAGPKAGSASCIAGQVEGGSTLSTFSLGYYDAMKPIAAIAALLLFLQPQAGLGQSAKAPPSAALVERFITVLPDRQALSAAGQEIDSAELSRLAALNPGKEAQLREILRKNLACTGPETEKVSLRMLRTVARDLGDAQLRQLVSFYEGPDYAVFAALAPRMEGKSAPSAKDSAAMARLMKAYPLQAFQEQLGRAGQIIAADQEFMNAAKRCASEHVKALEDAGILLN